MALSPRARGGCAGGSIRYRATGCIPARTVCGVSAVQPRGVPGWTTRPRLVSRHLDRPRRQRRVLSVATQMRQRCIRARHLAQRYVVAVHVRCADSPQQVDFCVLGVDIACRYSDVGEHRSPPPTAQQPPAAAFEDPGQCHHHSLPAVVSKAAVSLAVALLSSRRCRRRRARVHRVPPLPADRRGRTFRRVRASRPAADGR